MKIGDLGELGLIATLRDYVRLVKGSRLGFDEDASDLPVCDGQSIVINVDTFVAKTDLLPDMTWAQAGRKTAVMAMSDLVAKGTRPQVSLVSLCAPEDFETKDATEIIRGFSQYCLKSDVYFLGGDLGMSDDVILTAVALGVVDSNHIVTRGGAHVGDIIAVTGLFGLTSVAYQVLLKGLDAPESLRKRAVAEAYLPHIDFNLIPSLAKSGLVSSCMDSSDGLGKTLNTMAQQSSNLFHINRLPMASGVREFGRTHDLDELNLVMRGGEEFVCVVTIPAEKWDAAESVAREMGGRLMPIGHVKSGSGVKYESPEGLIDVPLEGYDSYKEWGWTG